MGLKKPLGSAGSLGSGRLAKLDELVTGLFVEINLTLSGYLRIRIKTMKGTEARTQISKKGMRSSKAENIPITPATGNKEITAVKSAFKIVLNNFILNLTFLFNYGILMPVLSRGGCYETN